MAAIDPSVLVAPDYQTQVLQAQHRLALSQALQQQSMTDTPGNGGTISWTQGLARILDAIAAKSTAKQGYQQMQGANQAYAAGLRSMFGQPPQAPQMPQGVPLAPSGTQAPQMPPQAPQQAPTGAPVQAGQADPLTPTAPPQAAPPPPSAPLSSAPTGGASSPWSLTGNPQKDMALYMSNPEEFGKAMIANASKGAAPTDTEILMSHAKQLAAQDDYQGAAMLQQQALKAGVMPLDSIRPGGVGLDPITHKPVFQAPKVGEGQFVTYGADGLPQRVANIPGALQSSAEQAAATAGAQAGAKAPYDVLPSFQNGQPGFQSKANVTGGVLNGRYYHGGQGLPSGPALGQSEAFGAYGKHSADAFAETQGIADSSPQRVQSLREMQSLITGPNALTTGPTAAKVQQLAEEHGLTFLAKDNAFVFNKDAARFVAQSAQDLGLNGSDNRLGMMANASPNMKMTPQALQVVVPTMIGLEYAKMAKATAAASWAQRDPGGNAKFESTWRQNYDPRMFTAYAQGGPQALAKAPANIRQQWLKDYRQLKGMGVDFTQFAQ